MRSLFYFILLFKYGNADVICADGKYSKKSAKLEEYIVDLDKDPLNRWDNLILDKKNELIHLIEVFMDFDKEYFQGFIIKLVDNYLVFINNDMPSPYKEEIKGISLISGISTARLVLYNIFYEIFTFCTSILAYNENSPNQTLYHVRNMDFGIFLGWDSKRNKWKVSEALRPVTVSLDFRKNNLTVYKAVSFVGYLGVLTAMKPGKFSLTVNERFAPDGGFLGIIMWVLGLQKLNWLSFFTRDVMEQANTFDEAKIRLQKTPLIAPVYFIIGGINKTQADIITRSQESMIDDRNFTSCCNLSSLVIENLLKLNNKYHSEIANPFVDKLNLNNVLRSDMRARQQMVTGTTTTTLVSRRPNHNFENFFQSLIQDIFMPKKIIYKLSSYFRGKRAKRDISGPSRHHPSADSVLHFDRFKNHNDLYRRHRFYTKRSLLGHKPFRHPNNTGESYWFLLETNYDWWKTPFFIDNRRGPAIQCLKRTKLHKEIDFSSLYDVLSTKPILNKLTVYTTLMNARDGIIETYIRDCDDPCPPW